MAKSRKEYDQFVKTFKKYGPKGKKPMTWKQYLKI